MKLTKPIADLYLPENERGQRHQVAPASLSPQESTLYRLYNGSDNPAACDEIIAMLEADKELRSRHEPLYMQCRVTLRMAEDQKRRIEEQRRRALAPLMFVMHAATDLLKMWKQRRQEKKDKLAKLEKQAKRAKQVKKEVVQHHPAIEVQQPTQVRSVKKINSPTGRIAMTHKAIGPVGARVRRHSWGTRGAGLR